MYSPVAVNLLGRNGKKKKKNPHTKFRSKLFWKTDLESKDAEESFKLWHLKFWVPQFLSFENLPRQLMDIKCLFMQKCWGKMYPPTSRNISKKIVSWMYCDMHAHIWHKWLLKTWIRIIGVAVDNHVQCFVSNFKFAGWQRPWEVYMFCFVFFF